MAARPVVLVVPLGVRNQQALYDAANRRAGGPQQHVKVVVQQTVAVQLKWQSLFEFGQRPQERLEILRLLKNRLPVVATIDNVVNETVVDGTQRARHAGKIPTVGRSVNKIVLTPFYPRQVHPDRQVNRLHNLCPRHRFRGGNVG